MTTKEGCYDCWIEQSICDRCLVDLMEAQEMELRATDYNKYAELYSDKPYFVPCS